MQLALKIQHPSALISSKKEEKMQLALKIQHPSASRSLKVEEKMHHGLYGDTLDISSHFILSGDTLDNISSFILFGDELNNISSFKLFGDELNNASSFILFGDLLNNISSLKLSGDLLNNKEIQPRFGLSSALKNQSGFGVMLNKMFGYNSIQYHPLKFSKGNSNDTGAGNEGNHYFNDDTGNDGNCNFNDDNGNCIFDNYNINDDTGKDGTYKIDDDYGDDGYKSGIDVNYEINDSISTSLALFCEGEYENLSYGQISECIIPCISFPIQVFKYTRSFPCRFNDSVEAALEKGDYPKMEHTTLSEAKIESHDNRETNQNILSFEWNIYSFPDQLLKKNNLYFYGSTYRKEYLYPAKSIH